MKKPIIVFLVLILAREANAQEEDSYVYRLDTIGKEKNVKIIGLPIAFSSPETSFGFGGGAQFILLNRTNIYTDRTSNILASVIYTLNEQLSIEAKPQIYFGKGDYFLDMEVKYKIFPNSFWGIGDETPDTNEERYNMTSTEVSASFLKRLPPLLNFGIRLNLKIHEVTETEEGGLLAQGDILGSNRAVISGMGIVFNFDSRDILASPNIGYYVGSDVWFSSENFGATSSFNKFISDIRTYQPIGKKNVLAMQLYSENSFGEVPFQGKVWYGGGDRGRGYFRGRFIDDHMYVAQLEYRWRFHSRWSAAGFGSVGSVADIPDNLFNDAKFSYGAGLRFKFVKSQETLLRLDFGFGEDGNSGLYFGVNEAF